VIKLLKDYLDKKGFKQEVISANEEKIIMDDYEFEIVKEGDKWEIKLPIPLPKGNESLDDLISMGISYARASRISQGLGAPLAYELKGNIVYILKLFNSREELEEKLVKALEGIESLRYFL
jgi:hypothetical protein